MAIENTKHSSQHIDNMSYNDTLEISERLIYGYDSTSGTAKAIATDSNGNLQTEPAGIGIPAYDYCSQAQAETTDTWTFKTGGSGGTTVATVTITYSDATKAVISNVART